MRLSDENLLNHLKEEWLALGNSNEFVEDMITKIEEFTVLCDPEVSIYDVELQENLEVKIWANYEGRTKDIDYVITIR